MERVTGIGGIFFKANDPVALATWYEKHLGVKVEATFGGAIFEWGDADGSTVWAPFKADTTYLGAKTFMVNYRVRDLAAMLAQLRDAGVKVDDKMDDTPQGKFGWAEDPEGNRIELWEPKP